MRYNTNAMEIQIIPAYDHIGDIQLLFAEYVEYLISEEPGYRDYLELQGFDDEFPHPEIKFGPPGGRLYLAMADGQAAGCAAFKRHTADSCEFKRLYVRPRFRGRHIGRMLVTRAMDDARAMGYPRMVLDTFPFLVNAIRLYRDLGFHDIESFNGRPMDTLIYLGKEL